LLSLLLQLMLPPLLPLLSLLLPPPLLPLIMLPLAVSLTTEPAKPSAASAGSGTLHISRKSHAKDTFFFHLQMNIHHFKTLLVQKYHLLQQGWDDDFLELGGGGVFYVGLFA
jgi:hypothetical protein